MYIFPNSIELITFLELAAEHLQIGNHVRARDRPSEYVVQRARRLGVPPPFAVDSECQLELSDLLSTGWIAPL